MSVTQPWPDAAMVGAESDSGVDDPLRLTDVVRRFVGKWFCIFE